KLVVVEKAISYGYETPLATEVKAALYTNGANPLPEVYSVVVGLGGKDVNPQDLVGIIEKLEKISPDRPSWWHEEELKQ
ncbi:MAG TPA: hypothetical protein ENG14_02050, partial [Thermodesulforhabdus norvegica]|nr:hypothetical protein [Thermodesulforhabdus norvegica]